jgi:hypothetical protein
VPSARYVMRQETFAGTRRNGQDAPKADHVLFQGARRFVGQTALTSGVQGWRVGIRIFQALPITSGFSDISRAHRGFLKHGAIGLPGGFLNAERRLSRDERSSSFRRS